MNPQLRLSSELLAYTGTCLPPPPQLAVSRAPQIEHVKPSLRYRHDLLIPSTQLGSPSVQNASKLDTLDSFSSLPPPLTF